MPVVKISIDLDAGVIATRHATRAEVANQLFVLVGDTQKEGLGGPSGMRSHGV